MVSRCLKTLAKCDAIRVARKDRSGQRLNTIIMAKPQGRTFNKNDKPRPQREAPASLVRKIELILELAARAAISNSMEQQADRHGVSNRTLTCAICRSYATIGEAEGFVITDRNANGIERLESKKRSVSTGDGQRGVPHTDRRAF